MRDNWEEEYNLFDAFVKVHATLYTPSEEYEPESYLVTRLQDRINMRKYFDTAISNIAIEI